MNKAFEQHSNDLADLISTKKCQTCGGVGMRDMGNGDVSDCPDCIIGVMHFAPCTVCGEETLVECDIEDFDPMNHYCGRTPRCCP